MKVYTHQLRYLCRFNGNNDFVLVYPFHICISLLKNWNKQKKTKKLSYRKLCVHHLTVEICKRVLWQTKTGKKWAGINLFNCPSVWCFCRFDAIQLFAFCFILFCFLDIFITQTPFFQLFILIINFAMLLPFLSLTVVLFFFQSSDALINVNCKRKIAQQFNHSR